MKRTILSLLLGLMSFSAVFGQRTTFALIGMTASGTLKTKDTTTNTDTTYLVLSTNATTSNLFNQYSDLVYTWTNTSITGTCAGNVIAQGSMTGAFSANQTGWYPLSTDKTQYAASAGAVDTTTVSGTTSGIFIIPNNQWKYVRLRYISSGTQTSVMTGSVTVMPHG